MRGAQWKRVSSGTLLAVVGGAVLALTAIYVRNPFGLAFGALFGATLLFSGRRLPAVWSSRLLMGLGLTSVLYAILDIKSDILDRPHIESDARMLADLTGIPTTAWGVLWIAIAIVAAFFLLRRTLRNA